MKTKHAKTIAQSLKNSAEFDFFLHNPLTRYEGKYVAILGKKVIASGISAKDVWDEATRKYPKQIPTIAKLPKEEVFIYNFCWERRFF